MPCNQETIMAFSRDDLEKYEKQPQKQVDDKLNPFRGATPARVADAAAVAAVAAGQVDATPGGKAAATASDPLVDEDAPIVDEDGTLGDPTDSGEGTSDEDADPSTADVDPSDETDPNTDLTGEAESEEAPTARPAPKKGSAEERIVELNDLLEGTKIFGKHMQGQLKDALSELERLKNGGKPTETQTAAAVAPPVEKDEPMPDLADADIAYDNDKYRAKMQKWSRDQAKIAAREIVREMTGADEAAKRRASVEAKIKEYSKTTPDYDAVVTKNPVLAANQLAFDAGVAVSQSEYTGQLLYKFGKDTALAIRTAKQSPAQQLITIGKMIAECENEDRVKASKGKQNVNGSKPNAQQGQQKSITKAPPPPSPTRAGGRAQARDPIDPNMSMDEFARQHRGSKQSVRENARKMRGLN
jgi:hypothetical protein